MKDSKLIVVAFTVLSIACLVGCALEKPEAPPATQAPAMPTPTLWGNLVPGDFWVGYRTVWLNDPARPMPDGAPRPMQASVWYPAEANPGTPALTYRDYLSLAASELKDGPADESEVNDEVNRFLSQLEGANVSSESASALIDSVMAARPDVPAAQGTFPLVLLAQGHGNSPNRQTVMCEYLASQGFVVITMPSQARISGFPKDEADAMTKVVEQADDLSFLALHSSEISPAGTRGLAVVGYSFGARSALAYAMRGGEAKAVISIDGGIGNAQGKELVETASWYAPDSFSIPLLHVYQPGDSMVEPDFDVIDRLSASDRLLVRVGGLKHGHFSNSGMLRTLGDGWDGLIAADLDPQPAFEKTIELTRAFLRANVEGERGELEALLAAGVTPPVDDIRSIPVVPAGE